MLSSTHGIHQPLWERCHCYVPLDSSLAVKAQMRVFSFRPNSVQPKHATIQAGQQRGVSMGWHGQGLEASGVSDAPIGFGQSRYSKAISVFSNLILILCIVSGHGRPMIFFKLEL